jgi:cytochrome c-type biogenesis protein CcmH
MIAPRSVWSLAPQLLAALIVCCTATLAQAVQPDEILPDAALEHRARDISAGLRCLVCQNQSIDDSDAPLARDLRLLVRERLKAGDSDDQVRDFLVARYGEFVLLKPPFAWDTALLWFAPLLILLGATALAARTVFSRRPAAASAGELSPAEREALDKLLADERAQD